MNENQSENPFAPVEVVQEVMPSAYGVWRSGDTLIVCGNALPLLRRCLKSGEPATGHHPVSQIWQPKWVYALLLFGLFPYFLVSPFVHYRVSLLVPVGAAILKKHQRRVKFGLILIAGSILGFSTVLLTGMWWYPMTNYIGPAFILGLFGFTIGLGFSSASPIKLNIINVDKQTVYLEGVHPLALQAAAPIDGNQP